MVLLLLVILHLGGTNLTKSILIFSPKSGLILHGWLKMTEDQHLGSLGEAKPLFEISLHQLLSANTPTPTLYSFTTWL